MDSTLIIFFIILFSIVNAFCVFLAFVWYCFILKRKEFFKKILSDLFLTFDFSSLADSEDSEEVERQVDHRLDDIIAGFKHQIPMIGMFLSKSKEEQLKSAAKIELIKMVPSIKKHFLQKLDRSSLQKMVMPRIGFVFKRLVKRLKYRFFWIAIVVGLTLGALEVLLFFYLTGWF